MKRVIEAEMETTCKKVGTAINRFFKKYPELEYWKEMFEYMAENNIEQENDCWFDSVNKIRNNDWRYALHLIHEENYTYMAVIERA